MKTRTVIALTAVALLSGVAGASAAGMSHPQSQPMMASKTSDTLSLTSQQRKTAWNDLSQTTKQKLPSGFNATVGAVVPGTFKIEPVPSKTAKDVPALKAYDFALVQGKVLIVNPSDRKIAGVIAG